MSELSVSTRLPTDERGTKAWVQKLCKARLSVKVSFGVRVNVGQIKACREFSFVVHRQHRNN